MVLARDEMDNVVVSPPGHPGGGGWNDLERKENHLMEMERNEALVRRFFQDVLNGGMLDLVDDLVTPDYALTVVGFPGPLDREGHKGMVAGIRAAFPDWEEKVEELVGDGDRVVARVVGRGTHRGEFMGIPATGRRVELVSVNIDRIIDGRIAERWLLPDTFGLLQQLGTIPAPELAEV